MLKEKYCYVIKRIRISEFERLRVFEFYSSVPGSLIEYFGGTVSLDGPGALHEVHLASCLILNKC